MMIIRYAAHQYAAIFHEMRITGITMNIDLGPADLL